MDQTTIDLLISNQNTLHADTKDLQRKIEAAQGRTDEKLEAVREDVSKIAGSIVGQERCTQIMGQLALQIMEVRQVCTRNETGKDAIAKDHEELVKRVDNLELDIEPRMKCLESQKIVVDYKTGLKDAGLKTITSSPVLGAIMALLAAIAARVYWTGITDMISEWGLHITLALIFSVAVLLFLTWKGRRKIADAGRGLAWTV